MNRRSTNRLSRRAFVGGVGAPGAVGLLGGVAAVVAAEPPLETGTIKLRQLVPAGASCGPQEFLAEDLLKAEGFTDLAPDGGRLPSP